LAGASFGAALAGALWTVATIVFAVYVNLFSSYNRTYGALAGVIVLMLWLYLSAFVILLGALVNAESDRALQGNTPPGPADVEGAPGSTRSGRCGRPVAGKGDLRR
jgi:membrane protein